MPKATQRPTPTVVITSDEPKWVLREVTLVDEGREGFVPVQRFVVEPFQPGRHLTEHGHLHAGDSFIEGPHSVEHIRHLIVN